MENTKVRAIVIGSKDYKDTGKLLTLFSLEKGVFYCVIKGIKSANAKLKAVKEPFCFADFVLAGNTDIQTVTSAEIIDSFYDITKDYNRLLIGAEIFKMLPKYSLSTEENSYLFLLVLKSLKSLAYNTLISEKTIYAKFMLELLSATGYKLNLDRCAECGLMFTNSRYLTPESGAIKCLSCKDENGIEISALSHATIKIIMQTPFDKLSSLKPNAKGLDETINILKKIL